MENGNLQASSINNYTTDMIKKIIILPFLIFLFSCTKSKTDQIKSILTNDSVGYWKRESFIYTIDNNYNKKEDFLIYYVNGRCENYGNHIGTNIKASGYGIGKLTWNMDTDSTLSMFHNDKYHIIYYTKDTIILKRLKYDKGIAVLTRSKEKWIFDTHTTRHRDSLDVIYHQQKISNIIY